MCSEGREGHGSPAALPWPVTGLELDNKGQSAGRKDSHEEAGAEECWAWPEARHRWASALMDPEAWRAHRARTQRVSLSSGPHFPRGLRRWPGPPGRGGDSVPPLGPREVSPHPSLAAQEGILPKVPSLRFVSVKPGFSWRAPGWSVPLPEARGPWIRGRRPAMRSVKQDCPVCESTDSGRTDLLPQPFLLLAVRIRD